ncbi:MAG: histidine phosphatase family protein [Akkermansia sp.]
MKTLIIARHGNTFRAGESPTRVGAHTDLELVEEARGRAVGKYLLAKGLMPDRILAAPLKRTMGTAQLAAEELGCSCPITPDARFIEVDYGPDENKTEDVVELQLGQRICAATGKCACGMSNEDIQQLGKEEIERWNTEAIVPNGWQVDVEQICKNWQELADSIAEGETLLCVSSNGTIRFAPSITGDYAAFCAEHDIKVATGGVCIFTSEDGTTWTCSEWGTKAIKKV